MEPKPFSIKAPEEVASAYGGNKQKIAQAIQMGALDPTSGLLAGMFIDRMRSAQAMEQAPQQSVAQQVFAPPAPPAPPAGLGAIAPQGGGMPAPPPSAPPAGLGAMPPVGMAAGGMTELPDSYGLESLPIPDNMYNEESFAGGGIVAFSGGGLQDEETRLRAIIADPRTTKDQKLSAQIALRGLSSVLGDPEKFRTGLGGMREPIPSFAERVKGGGEPMLNAYLRKGEVDFNPEEAMMTTSRATPTSGGGFFNPHASFTSQRSPWVDDFNALDVKSLGNIVPPPARTPAPRGERGVVGGATRAPAGATAPAAGTTPEMSDEDIAEKRMQGFLDAAKLPAPKGTTAEEKAARKNEDLWSALAQIGFGMAAGESPNFLTNVGKATAAAIPGMQESLKERRADTKEELKQQYAYELAQAGVTGDAYKLKLNQFDRLEDNRYRKETLAETIRGNRRREELQEQQIAASYKPTGTENLVKLIAAGKAPGATDEQKRLADAAEYALKGYAGAVGGAEIANKATDNIKDRLKTDVALASRLRALAAQDKKNAKAGEPTTLYDTEYNRLVQDETNRLQNMSLSTIGGSAGNGRVKSGWSLLPEPQS